MRKMKETFMNPGLCSVSHILGHSLQGCAPDSGLLTVRAVSSRPHGGRSLRAAEELQQSSKQPEAPRLRPRLVAWHCDSHNWTISSVFLFLLQRGNLKNEILVSEMPSLGGWRDISMVNQKVIQYGTPESLEWFNSESDHSNVIAPSLCIFLFHSNGCMREIWVEREIKNKIVLLGNKRLCVWDLSDAFFDHLLIPWSQWDFK